MPGRLKVLRYLCVRIKALTSLGTFSQFPPYSNNERPLQAYSDSQAVVGYTNHEEEVANILRLLYHVVLLPFMQADSFSLQFQDLVLESSYRSFPHVATAAGRRHDRRVHKNKE